MYSTQAVIVSALILASIATGIYYYFNKYWYNDEISKNDLFKTFVIYFIVSCLSTYLFGYVSSIFGCSGCELGVGTLSGGGNNVFGNVIDTMRNSNADEFLTKPNVEKFNTGIKAPF